MLAIFDLLFNLKKANSFKQSKAKSTIYYRIY